MARKKISELTSTTTPSLDAIIPIVQGSPRATLQYKPALPLNIVAFGASTSGTAAANTAAIQAATAAAASTGLPLFVPPGEYLMADGGGSIALNIAALSNVTMYGVPGASILKLGNSQNAHLINIDGGSNIVIRDLVLDGNRANQTLSVHGIRVGTSGVLGLRVQNCEVRQAAGYGIGLQGGTKRRVFLESLYVHDTGSDSIDFKNTADDAEQIIVDGVVLENWGLNSALSVQSGLDCRGPCQVSNVTAKGGPADGSGIRFRDGELASPSGFGAHRSHLVNFHLEGSGGTSVGLDIAARDVAVHGGYVTGAFRGVSITAERAKLTAVTVEDSLDDGFLTGSGAHDVAFIGCTAQDNASDSGFRLRGDRGKIIGCYTAGNNVGVSIEATADGSVIESTTFLSNTTSVLGDSGTGTRIGANNTGLAGLLASSVSESVAAGANSANLDTSILASTSYRFRVQADAEDASGNRCLVVGTLRARRSSSGAPSVGTDLAIEQAEGSWLWVQPSASGNNLRINVRNDMGADCHMTIRVWEIDRAATVEDS